MNIKVEPSLTARLSLTNIALLDVSSITTKLTAAFENWRQRQMKSTCNLQVSFLTWMFKTR